MKKMQRIVITGGPCGGKSTALQRIKELNSSVTVVPEAATLLLSGGFPAPDSEHAWDSAWQKNFQTVVASTQIALEEEYMRRAKKAGSSVILFDRGLLDGAAYLDGGITELEEITKIPEEQMLVRYDSVLHLPSIALLGATEYDKSSNPHRFEEAEDAQRLDERVLQAWQGHANHQVVTREEIVTTILSQCV